jgi:hypothetical protein
MIDKAIKLTGAALQSAQGQVEAWTMVSFAQPWLRDAVRESKQEGPDHRRREIVFVVCFVESYLFEVVRDLVLLWNFKETLQYFPVSGHRRGITKRCKKVFINLHKDGKIKQSINWNSPFWTDFCRLVEMRDGLVHASISRPDNNNLLLKEKPTPSPGDFYKLSQGWALKAALGLVRAMHDAIGMDVPHWIADPDLLLQH